MPTSLFGLMRSIAGLINGENRRFESIMGKLLDSGTIVSGDYDVISGILGENALWMETNYEIIRIYFGVAETSKLF